MLIFYNEYRNASGNSVLPDAADTGGRQLSASNALH